MVRRLSILCCSLALAAAASAEEGTRAERDRREAPPEGSEAPREEGRDVGPAGDRRDDPGRRDGPGGIADPGDRGDAGRDRDEEPAGPGREGEAASRGEDGRPGDDARVRDLVLALSREMEGLGARIAALRERVRRLRESLDLPPGPPAREAAAQAEADRGPPGEAERPPGAAPWLRDGDSRALDRLHLRQRALLERWRALAGSEEVESRRAVEAELRAVLLGILDIRDGARAAEVARLRVEVDSMEREIALRREESVRRRLVEERLRALLDGIRDR